MGRPRMIILIRHAQSEGNKSRAIHQTIPDHRVKLTAEGWAQSLDAGRRLRSLLSADDTLHFFTSPYRRTRETTEGILTTLTADDPSPSPFPRSKIKVYEEPRLREQDFGNFQPCSAEMERMWQERADYGHFFYRIPNGESAADAYDRISGFNESLWRQFGEDDCASVCILVTHGLMSRVFLMKWYHFSVEYFEDLRNVNHCEFLIMRRQETGKYTLENKLRTWSELHEEREAEQKEKEKSMPAETAVARPPSPAPKQKQWGGCPNGCSHGKYYTKKEKLFSNGATNGTQLHGKEAHLGDVSLVLRRPTGHRLQSNSSEGDEDDSPRGRTDLPRVDVHKSLEEAVSSPNATPLGLRLKPKSSVLTHTHVHANIPILQVGRDFGGSASGDDMSRAGSDTEASSGDGDADADGEAPKPSPPKPNGNSGDVLALRLAAAESCLQEVEGMGKGARADALGDQSDFHANDDLLKEEAADRSIGGSVY